ncbi:MAG: hypothetical protein FWE01_01210 [Firmicutes bacterium]|nr:hypothetical protein [Bacillota bacterium]
MKRGKLLKFVLLIGVGMMVIPILSLVGCGRNIVERPDFCDRQFSVNLSNSASLAIIDQSILDGELPIVSWTFFPELQGIGVENSSLFRDYNIRRQRMGLFVDNPINMDTFNMSLTITLIQPDRQRIVEYVNILNETRNDIEWASVIPLIHLNE